MSDRNCTAMEILLTEYCAGELDPAEATLLEEHLSACAACRAELAREKYLRGQLDGLPLASCPSRVTDRILAGIEPPAPPARQPPSVLTLPAGRWTAAVGAVAAAAAVVLLLFGTPSDPGREGVLTGGDSAPTAYSEAQIDAARRQAEKSLLLTARILSQAERSTVKEVFGRTLPESLQQSIKLLMTTPEGGQG